MTNTEKSEILPSPLPSDGNGNTLFAAVRHLDVHLTALVHAALVLAAQRPELCGRARRTMGGNRPEVNAGTSDSSLRWSIVDDRALEEAVVQWARGRRFGRLMEVGGNSRICVNRPPFLYHRLVIDLSHWRDHQCG